jgi:hypothetical protein
MSKKLNELGLESELSGSAFFQSVTERSRPRHEATAAEGKTAGNAASMPSRPHATMPPVNSADDLIEVIRKAVKQLGKEEATYRLTPEEKQTLAEVVYSYGLAGLKTSQNEITRIAVNYLLEDYRANREKSVLARVLERLNG